MGKSHQRGSIVLRGKKWYGYFRRAVIDPETNEPKATVIPVVLEAKSELSKFEAREALEREIAKVTGTVPSERSAVNASTTFGWFVRNRFLPLKEADWKKETAKVKRYLIEADLIEKFDEDRLAEADLPSDPAHDRNLGSEGRDSERCAGCAAALSHSNHHACLHAGDSRGVRERQSIRSIASSGKAINLITPDLERRVPQLTFQVIRRTMATLAQKKGTVKDVQRMMRHSRVATTTDVYMQELPEGVRTTVDSIHNELHRTMARLATGSTMVN